MKTLAWLGVPFAVLAACGGVSVLGVDRGAVGAADASASLEDAAPSACTIPAYLQGDAGRAGGCFADRALVECKDVEGCSDICLSPDFTRCPSSPGGGSASCGSSSGPDTTPASCSDLCAVGEYAVTCDTAQGPNYAGATISPPPSCHAPTAGAASAETYSVCCPCGT